ncbi:MAG TPA: penicillin-binding transpeptidase domain-containing protein [Candidatus Eisenbacteria bacterium]|nr:penicillin-binding transpeptidase domain-containing protein [Candidatus Eisenbacteria bacterium]
MRVVVCIAVCLTLWDLSWPQDRPADGQMLQPAVTRAMARRRGTAVVLGVATGKILAAYQLDVAAQRVALPGSSIKPFTLLALLQAGKVNGHTALMCKRPLTIGGHKLDCTHPDIKQPIDPDTALAYSCNSYFTTVALRLTPAELQNGLRQYGFAAPSGLSQNEAMGSVALAGTQAELQLEAIGEWGVRVTPLELLRGYRNLALLSQEHDAELAPLFEGLEGSVSYGMGHFAQPDAALKVAGKTGTSLVEEGSWRHGWFAGYAPAGKPEIALVVFLEKGHGPTDAASAARQIFAAYFASRSRSRSDGVGH